jgi:hypothetical protein
VTTPGPAAADRAEFEAEYLGRIIGLGLIQPDADDRLNRSDIRKAQTRRADA